METMNLSDIYKTWQSSQGGSSGRGNSFYSSAADCGRRAVLNEIDSQRVREFVPATEPSALKTGTAYHFWHQLAWTASLPEDLVLDMTDKSVDADFLEGLRLFNGWKQLWGSIGAKYGEVVGIETNLDAPEFMFGGKYTGREDAVVNIQDTAGVQLRTGLYLEPGVYIVDWKSAKGANKLDDMKFTQGTQARGYMSMHPEAKGVIFDVLYKMQSFRHEPKLDKNGKVSAGKSYAHYLQLPQHDDKQVISALVKIGKHNFENNLANPSACLRGFEPCPFFVNGRCSGY